MWWPNFKRFITRPRVREDDEKMECDNQNYHNDPIYNFTHKT